ncbi:MAG: hypothetical protein KDA48_13655, partial [Amphiplicatus sp.]|nr:hypothetical protein [Amphiplicatus sp.]
MSKSLGNFVTIHELLHTEKFGGTYWAGPVLRHAMLLTHYRQPIDFSLARLKEAAGELNNFALVVLGKSLKRGAAPSDALIDALSDDINYAEARTILQAAAKKAQAGDELAAQQLFSDCEFLGLFDLDRYAALRLGFSARGQVPAGLDVERAYAEIQVAFLNDNGPLLQEWKKRLERDGHRFEFDNEGFLHLIFGGSERFEASVEALIAARLEARKSKNWAESDRIRDELLAMGIALKDNKDGTTTWEVKR